MKFIEQNDLKQLALENTKVCISRVIPVSHFVLLYFFVLFLCSFANNVATLWKLFFLHFVAKKSASFIEGMMVGNDVLIGANNRKSKTERPKIFTVSYCYLNHCFTHY